MPFQPFLNGAGTNIYGFLNAVPVENTLWFLDTLSNVTQGRLTELSQGLAEWVENRLVAATSQYATFTQVRAYDAATNDGAEAVTNFPAGTVGMRNGLSMPNVLSAEISFSTERRGKRFNSGNNIWGLLKDDTSGDLVIDSVRNGYLTAYQWLLGVGAVAPGWILVAISRQKDKVKLPQVETAYVNGFAFNTPFVGTQRGRAVKSQ